MQGGGGSPEQSQEVVSDYEIVRNYEQSSARRGKPRFGAQARALAFNAKGGEPAEQAFTMAEILLSLTIIGVVAAITLPSLTGNINERTWNTQRKALYARFSQAISLMPALNGYGTLTEGNSSTAAEDTAAETFLADGLSKVLKINNICASDHLDDCGIPQKMTDFRGNLISSFPTTLADYNSQFSGTTIDAKSNVFTYHQTNTKAAAFETANGESIVVFYNPNCRGNTETQEYHWSQPYMCANFVYDLNGAKGPNTVGKDIGFITALYPSDPVVVAPVLMSGKGISSGNKNQIEAGAYCNSLDNQLRLPNIDEASSMFYNRLLVGYATENAAFWSSTVLSKNGGMYAWRQSFLTGSRNPLLRTSTTGDGFNQIFCIAR